MKDFKRIADDIMSDIHVTDKLKRETLERCREKRHYPLKRYLVPAACLLLIISLMRFSSISGNNFAIDMNSTPEANILMASPDSPRDSAVSVTWELNTLEEAEKAFGNGFLIPAYIPDSYRMDKILAAGKSKDSADLIRILFIYGEKEIQIIEEKSAAAAVPEESKSIRINGAMGHQKSSEVHDSGFNIELFWYVNGIQYSLNSPTTEQEALKMAESMK